MQIHLCLSAATDSSLVRRARRPLKHTRSSEEAGTLSNASTQRSEPAATLLAAAVARVLLKRAQRRAVVPPCELLEGRGRSWKVGVRAVDGRGRVSGSAVEGRGTPWKVSGRALECHWNGTGKAWKVRWRQVRASPSRMSRSAVKRTRGTPACGSARCLRVGAHEAFMKRAALP